MTVSVTPGVYRQVVEPPPPRVLRTGVPVFIGPSGPSGSPTQVTRAGTVTGALGAAVDAFFANGGSLCYLAGGSLDDALASLDGVDDVDLICLPELVATQAWTAGTVFGDVVTAQRQVLDHCAARGDRFAVLDAVPSFDPDVLLAQRARLAGPSASFGALYAPWVYPTPGTARPPSGHVAGVYAAADRVIGTHRAPANVALDEVLDVQATFAEAELGELTGGGVNVLRTLPGRGIRVWGARTIADDEWRDVTARRIVIEISRWISTFMTLQAYEPNDVRLWVSIMRQLTAYLETMGQRGALGDFYVKCDSETNPPAGVAAGLVVTQVGLTLPGQVEYIVITLTNQQSAP